ncbi:hypothetical protein BDP27DRAFT_1427109 [Rhodocollybia butyracea]|uniref:Uncharacterized protein n=1 Tax=Rhodocollybia butyracea TaxID=206335 RepID=A0A9P5PH11_9AGAR|nr:hypothetical protein BDP27DRAFT_1427109 [Rhodocollybia butyracea]
MATATTQPQPGFWEQYATTASMYNLPVPVPYEQQQSIQPPRIAIQQLLHQPPVITHNPQQYLQQLIPAPQSFVPPMFAYNGQGVSPRSQQPRIHTMNLHSMPDTYATGFIPKESRNIVPQTPRLPPRQQGTAAQQLATGGGGPPQGGGGHNPDNGGDGDGSNNNNDNEDEDEDEAPIPPPGVPHR